MDQKTKIDSGENGPTPNALILEEVEGRTPGEPSRLLSKISWGKESSRNARTKPGRFFSQLLWGVQEKIWLSLDFGIAWLSVWVSFLYLTNRADPTLSQNLYLACSFFGLSFIFVGYLFHLYDRHLPIRLFQQAMRGSLAALIASLATLSFFYLVYFQTIGRVVLGFTVLLTALISLLARAIFGNWIQAGKRKVLFLGSSVLGSELVQALQGRFSKIYEPIESELSSGPELVEFCYKNEIDEIVLPADLHGQEHSWLNALQCAPSGCRIRTLSDLYEDVYRRVPVDHASLTWFLRGGWDSTSHFRNAVKRLSDIVLASLFLVTFLPVMLLIALAIRLSSKGPIFYQQTRVGEYGKLFSIYKFRTMKVNAETGKAQWASEKDPRIHPFGRFLRATRLDELPQLGNILRGQMSFVGPRPERPEFTKNLEKWIPLYSCRHLMRPGLSGWAQIHYRYGASVDDAKRKLEYDLFYVRHHSLWMDLGIILRTLTTFMRGGR